MTRSRVSCAPLGLVHDGTGLEIHLELDPIVAVVLVGVLPRAVGREHAEALEAREDDGPVIRVGRVEVAAHHQQRPPAQLVDGRRGAVGWVGGVSGW